jgi:hypothetical protein
VRDASVRLIKNEVNEPEDSIDMSFVNSFMVPLLVKPTPGELSLDAAVAPC